MTSIQFSHANGFPASSYEYLFSKLDNTDINYINTLGHAEGFQENCLGKDLMLHLRDELIADIEARHSSKVVGVGHSSGAVLTLIAAVKRPELFEQVILLDPVIFSFAKKTAIWLVNKLGLWERMSLVNKTKRRRVTFKDRHQAFDYFKDKTLFKDFHPKCFQSYIDHGLKDAEQGVELTFSAVLEADIYRNVPVKIAKNLDNIKVTIISGSRSNVFSSKDVNWWQKHYPHFQMICLEGSHLFPFEEPEKTASILNQIIQ